MLKNQAIQQLREEIDGEIVLPDQENFAEAREIWNSRLGKQPALIARCRGTWDVAAAVKFARNQSLSISVKSGGHSYAGHGVGNGGLLVDLSLMKGINIDVLGKKTVMQPGVLWGEFHEVSIDTGLAACGGTVSSVGVAGFTLGGGSGYLARKHGLAIDNLLSAELVTAEGKIIQVSESTEPDLFWAIRGGGGNYGIVTQFEFQLHDMHKEILSGQVMYSFANARNVLQTYREVMLGAPDELVCYPCFFRVPPIPDFPESLHGQVVISLVIGYTGDIEDGNSVVQPLRKIAEPITDTIGVHSWVAVNQMFDPGVPNGMRWYSQAHDMNALPDEAIDTAIKHAENLQGAFTFAYFDPLGGAISRVPPSKTAYAGRKAQFGFHVLAGWFDGKEDSELIAWAKAFHRDMAPFSNGGVYVNLLAEDEADRIAAAYGANLPRLRKIKKKWDPDNLFKGNHNIAPD